MKRFFVLGLFALSVCSLSAISVMAASSMTVETSVSLSDAIDAPSVIDSIQTITLTFSEPLNPETVADGVKLYKVQSTGQLIEETCISSFDHSTPTILTITQPDGAAFAEGEEYKIAISNNIQSTNGMSLGKDFTGYFATNYSFILGSEGIPELYGQRSLIICISDIHIGDARTIAGGYNGFEKNKKAFVNFLNQIRFSPNVKELVIAGDMLDEWVGPMTDDPLNGMTESGFLDSVAAANQTVIDALNHIIQDWNVKVTYIPGNHDMLVSSEDMQRIFPGISEARDAQGLGAYSPVDHPEIIIEHGHRYELFCAPDPISNRSITNTDSILPPGFFFTRWAYSSIIEHPSSTNPLPDITFDAGDENQSALALYWNIWNLTMTDFPVTGNLDDKVIKTNINGYTETYAINQLIPYNLDGNGPLEMKLYKEIFDSWDERQTINQIPVKYGVEKAISDETDLVKGDFRAFNNQAILQYFHNEASNKRIVVFGHTHAACIEPSFNLKSQKTIYANSGTWQDFGDPNLPSMTFVVITPQKTSNSTPEYVTLYQYSQSGEITKFPNQAAITNLEPMSSSRNGQNYK